MRYMYENSQAMYKTVEHKKKTENDDWKSIKQNWKYKIKKDNEEWNKMTEKQLSMTENEPENKSINHHWENLFQNKWTKTPTDN
jgi:hypothetical protein